MTIKISKNRILLIIFIALFCASVAIATYLFIPRQGITLKNENKFYTVSYHQTKLFDYYLDKWKLLVSADRKKKYNLEIVITDKIPPNTIYRLRSDPTNPEMLIATSVIRKGNIKIVTIFLGKGAQKYTKEQVADMLISPTFRTLIHDSSDDKTILLSTQDLRNTFAEFSANPKEIPFEVIFK